MTFTIAPSMVQVEDKYWNILLEEYPDFKEALDRNVVSEELLQFAHKNNLTMIDLYPILKKAKLRNKSLYYAKEQHWTTYGNQVVADFLYDYLLKNYSFE